MLVHLVDRAKNPDDQVGVEALCGALGFEFDDGTLIPDEFDYVFLPDPKNVATCMPCLDRWCARHNAGHEQERVEGCEGDRENASQNQV